MLERFGWSRVVIISPCYDPFASSAEILEEYLESKNVRVYRSDFFKTTFYEEEKKDEIKRIQLLKAKDLSHVFIIIADEKNTYSVLTESLRVGLFTARYVFISIDSDETLFKLNDNFNGFINIRQSRRSRSSLLKDSLKLLERALVQAKNNDLIKYLSNNSFGDDIVTDKNGDPVVDHLILNYWNGSWLQIFNHTPENSNIIQPGPDIIHWPGGLLKPPDGEPECGWDGEKCTKSSKYLSIEKAIRSQSHLIIYSLQILTFTNNIECYNYVIKFYTIRIKNLIRLVLLFVNV